ncbi:TIGR03032 family protein [Bowmanella denitrificans]|uniref:TIGR03032 family protein n=1 Tax=Bowmanella denitrificans TaxID=366582 RepID=UPI000C998128|nr:TIGR03032 family protein [Bowmanella denitrificans]
MFEETNSLKDQYKEMDYGAEYSANLPAILKHLNVSLIFTSYQAGRLMLVRSDGQSLDINFKRFSRPMGISVTEDSVTLGIFTQVLRFQREDGLLEKIKQPLERIEDDITAPRVDSDKAKKGLDDPLEQSGFDLPLSALAESEEDLERLERQLKLWQEYQESLFQPADPRVDACFITRSAHYSGMINIHDIDWGDDGLWAVNSSFSCLCTLEPDFSFVPQWKPPFISELAPEDRCHLNGMALKNGRPGYVTTFSKDNQATNWRNRAGKFEGTLIDVQKNEILLENLSMPHSPRWYQGRVYFCNSGQGEICSYNPDTGDLKTIAEVPGFTRGISFYGPLMFVGLSKVRKSDVTRPAPLGEKYDETYSGIWVFNLEDGTQVGQIRFSGNVDQIYDVAVLPGCSFPEVIEPSHPRMRNHFCFPPLQSGMGRGLATSLGDLI